MKSFCGLFVGLVAMAAGAQPPAAAASDCAPACRASYVCVRGQCVSACNPPCAAGEQCTASGECAPAAAPISAPPPPPAQPTAEGADAEPVPAESAPGGELPGWPYDRSTYPDREIDRPLTLPAGVVEPYSYLTTTLPSRSTSSVGNGLLLGVAVGLGPRFELTTSTGLGLTPGTPGWNESLSFYGAFLAVHQRRLQIAPSLGFSPVFGTRAGSAGVQVFGFTTGPDVRVRLTDKLSLRGLDSLLFVDPSRPFVSMSLDAALEIQASPTVFLAVETWLASATLVTNTGTPGDFTTITDRLPVGFRALFALGRRVDLSVRMSLAHLLDPSLGASAQVGVLTRI